MVYDDVPRLNKPTHVDRKTWDTFYGEYAAALAIYRRLVGEVDQLTRVGRAPTEDQLQAEDNAGELLKITRTALLRLYRKPPDSY